MTPLRRATLAVALLAGVVFLPSLANGFALDDLTVVANNPALHDLRRLPELLGSPWWPVSSGRELGLWRPATSLALALTWAVGGGAPWIFHLTNLVLHALASALVVLLVSELFSLAAGIAAGVVFALHPVHVEAVANVVGQAELLAAVPVLGACVLVARTPGAHPAPGDAAPDAPRTLAILGLFATGLLAKEVAVVLPALVVLVDAVRRRLTVAGLRPYLRRRAPLFVGMAVVLVAFFLARWRVLGSFAPHAEPPLGAALLTDIPRIWTMAPVWLEYLRLLVWPARLLPDYSPAVVAVRTTWSPVGVAGALAVLAILGVALAAARRTGARWAPLAGLPFGVLWFATAILPVSNLLFLAGVLLAERTLYLPSVGFAAAIGVGAAALLPRRGRPRASVRVIALVLAGGLALRTLIYVPVWRDQATLIGYLLDQAPESGRSRWARADLLLREGRQAEALRAYRAAVPLLGSSRVFNLESGRKLLDAGLPRHARPFLVRAWELDPGQRDAPLLLAVQAAAEERWAEVERWARAAIRADDASVPAWHLLATALGEEGRWPEARAAREALLQRGERDAWLQWYWLAQARARSGDPDGARDALDSARARAPGPEERRTVDSLRAAIPGGGGAL